MSFLNNLTTQLPFLNKPSITEHYFALNISPTQIKVCIWTVDGTRLLVNNPSSATYKSFDDILGVADGLLDQALGELPYEPEKILFGVPDDWLIDDDLKPGYLKLLRNIVKSLELKPMAYVATSHALSHFLEKKEGAPATAIFLGIEESNITVTVVRAGKIDGTKIIKRSSNLGEDLEKILLTFTSVEVLPSRILIYSQDATKLDKQKDDLLSFPWMDRLPFLHFPKLDALEADIDIKAVALAGAVELNSNVKYIPAVSHPESVVPKQPAEDITKNTQEESGFITGDITESQHQTATATSSVLMQPKSEPVEEIMSRDQFLFEEPPTRERGGLMRFTSFIRIPSLGGKFKLIIPLIIIVLTISVYLFLLQGKVIIFVEPRVLERDTQVVADPTIKEINNEAKKIPGQILEVAISGSEKIPASGRKQVGDPAKGNVVIYNATSTPINLNSGATLVSDSGQRFTLNTSVQIASKSASAASPPTKSDSVGVTAEEIGPDGNIPSEVELKVGNLTKSEVVAKSEGNFSGGTSREVTVVTDTDHKKLLASLAANLRKKAQGQLQAKLQDQKNNSGMRILEEALTEEITRKNFNKNIGDQASEFSLNLTIRYKGTAYSENDLKMIVSKLVETNIPEDFELNLAETETQADVSKVEKDGTLIFLARFKAKLIPKLDQEKIKKQIRSKTPSQAAEILKGYENVLGSEIEIIPPLPFQIARLPLIDRNIKIEVRLK